MALPFAIGPSEDGHNCGHAIKTSLLHMPSSVRKEDTFLMRHNELRDSIANLKNDVCHDLEIEPHLQSLQGETVALK